MLYHWSKHHVSQVLCRNCTTGHSIWSSMTSNLLVWQCQCYCVPQVVAWLASFFGSSLIACHSISIAKVQLFPFTFIFCKQHFLLFSTHSSSLIILYCSILLCHLTNTTVACVANSLLWNGVSTSMLGRYTVLNLPSKNSALQHPWVHWPVFPNM